MDSWFYLKFGKLTYSDSLLVSIKSKLVGTKTPPCLNCNRVQWLSEVLCPEHCSLWPKFLTKDEHLTPVKHRSTNINGTRDFCHGHWIIFSSSMASSIFLQHSPFLAAAFQFCIWGKSMASSRLSLGLPTGLPLKHLPITFLGTRELSGLTMWPAHCSLYCCKNVWSTTS